MPTIVSVVKTAVKTVTVTFDIAVTAASATAGGFYLTYNSGSPIAATSVAQNGTNALDVTAASWPADPTGQPYWAKGSSAFYPGLSSGTKAGFVANAIGIQFLADLAAATSGQTVTLTAANYDIGQNFATVPPGVTLVGLGSASSTLTSHYIGTPQNGTVTTSPQTIGHCLVEPGFGSIVGSLTIVAAESTFQAINVITGGAGLVKQAYQMPLGVHTSGSNLFRNVQCFDINIAGYTDCLYFNPGLGITGLTGTLTRITGSAAYDTFNALGDDGSGDISGTITLVDCVFNASGPSFASDKIVRGIHSYGSLVVDVINPTIICGGSVSDVVMGCGMEKGTLNLSGTGTITVAGGGTLQSLHTATGAVINVATSQTIIYDQTKTDGVINGTIGSGTATLSVPIAWAFTGASYFTGTLNGVDQGTITSGSSFTLTNHSNNTLLLFAFDAANKGIARGFINVPVGLQGAALGFSPWAR